MSSRSSFVAGLLRRCTFSNGLVAGFVLLNALVLALVLVSIERNRDSHRDQAVVATRNLAQLVARSLSDSFAQVDRELLVVSDEVKRESDVDVNDGRILGDFIVRAFSPQPDFDSLGVADAQGNVIYASDPVSSARASVAERNFFARTRDAPGATTAAAFSDSAGGNGDGETGVVLARRIERSPGGFAGVVYAVLGRERLHKAIGGVDLGPSGMVAVRDLDFGLLVRRPPLAHVDSTIEAGSISSAFRQSLVADPDTGSFTSKNGFDGVERTNTFRKLSGFPYYVVVGLATDDYLRGWRQESVPTVVLAAGFALLTFALSELLNRFWRRREAALDALARQEAKYRKLLDCAPDALVIIDAKGVIEMINERTESMFGYSRVELVGQNVEILLPERHRKEHAGMIARYVANAQTRKMGVGRPLRGAAKDGREFSVNISLSPIETAEGLLITADIRDMTGIAAGGNSAPQ